MTDNFFLNGIILAQTLLLFLSTSYKKRITGLLTLGLLFALSLFLLINYFDKSMFITTESESIKIQERRNFYNKELGRIYGNRVGIFYFDKLRPLFGKLSSNFFSTLEPTRYFSPDFLISDDKYPLILAILAIFGIIIFIKDTKTVPLIYFIFATGIGSFISSGYQLIPMFALVNFFILVGFLKSLQVAQDFFKKI